MASFHDRNFHKTAIEGIGYRRDPAKRDQNCFLIHAANQAGICLRSDQKPGLCQCISLRKSKARIKHRRRDRTDLDNLDNSLISTVTISEVSSLTSTIFSYLSAGDLPQSWTFFNSVPTLIHISISLEQDEQ